MSRALYTTTYGEQPMSATIKATLEDLVPLQMTQTMFDNITRYCQQFETRDNHSLALNSPYLGLHKCFFTTKDQENYFSMFDISTKELTQKFGIARVPQLISNLSQGELRKVLIKLDAVDASRKVQSDPFNIFSTYAMHKAATSPHLNNAKRQMLTFTLMKILEYKFFTSIVNYRFKYGCDEGAMKATIDNLSNKFAITQQGTWKSVLETRATELISPKSIHYDTITKYNDDMGILYLITDVQTRIRNQLNIVTTAYYQTKEKGDTIRSYGLVGNDLDGEKIVMSQISTFDTMTANLVNEMMSVHQFIQPDLIEVICKMYKNVRKDVFRGVLIKMSELALEQSKFNSNKAITKSLDYVMLQNGEERYIGMRSLMINLIQKTYRYCIQSRTNMNSKLDILKTTKDVYGSSRISDPNIIAVRESIALLMDRCNVSRRAATVASLRIAIVVYIIIKTFRYL